jgi:hypothetical protein
MEILSADELDARISQVQPLTKATEAMDDQGDGMCPIRCPWAPDTRISVVKAKLYAAELGRLVAESENRALLRELRKEQERSKTLGTQYSTMSSWWAEAKSEVAVLKKQRRGRRAR